MHAAIDDAKLGLKVELNVNVNKHLMKKFISFLTVVLSQQKPYTSMICII